MARLSYLSVHREATNRLLRLLAIDGGDYAVALPSGDWLYNGSLRECDAFIKGWSACRVFGPKVAK